MCGDIDRDAFADLRLRGNSEHKIDFLMDQSMGWLCDQMKRTTRLICNRSMVINRELTGQVRGKNSMDCPTVHVIRGPMAMVGLGMNMDQWQDEHPQGHPGEKHAARRQGGAILQVHSAFKVAQFADAINQCEKGACHWHRLYKDSSFRQARPHTPLDEVHHEDHESVSIVELTNPPIIDAALRPISM